MELKLGSVWLLLSCSLQQSLWGILASVPQTNAKKCISDQGEVRKVQMLKRIPARCSGWDEAWSWLSQKDCRTRYKMDYVELPRAVQKVEDKDCEPSDSQAAKAESENYFNVSDEKFLAIAFGSATVALLILIVIIVLSLVRRGQICVTCCGSPAYRTTNATERETREENQRACNAYVEDGLTLMESEYEEILDPSTKEKKLALQDDKQGTKYQNVPLYPNEELKALEKGSLTTSNGALIPSAPTEEELRQNHAESVPNDYTDFIGHVDNSVPAMHDDCGNNVSRFTHVGKDLVEGSKTQQSDNVQDIAAFQHKPRNCSLKQAAVTSVLVKSDEKGCNSVDVNDTNGTKLSDGSNGSNVHDNPCETDGLIKTTNTEKACDAYRKQDYSTKNNEDQEKSVNDYTVFSDYVKQTDSRPDAEDDGSFTDYEEPISAPLSSHSYENLDPETQVSHQNKTVYESLAHSPVYCEPQSLSDSPSGTPSSRNHVTMNGLPDNYSEAENKQTGSKLHTKSDDSINKKNDLDLS